MLKRRALLLIAAWFSVAAVWLLAYIFFVPFGKFSSPVIVDLPRGTTSYQAARRLAQAGAVPSRWHFLMVRLLRLRQAIQAGEYRFESPATVWEVYRRLAIGDAVRYKLTVPEGSNIWEIARLLEEQKLIGERQFLAATRNAELVRDLAPQAQSLEGFLFPSTYFLSRTTTAGELVAEMVRQFRRVWRQIGQDQDVYRTVTLASLIEKETALAEERPLVASVYLNRLQRGMLLQCDPTVIYAARLENDYHGVISRRDLERASAFNTYQRPGLPPGPIANPGVESLKAAMNPAKTAYLYFVAKPDGSGAHVFSVTLEAHNHAAQRFRRAARR